MDQRRLFTADLPRVVTISIHNPQIRSTVSITNKRYALSIRAISGLHVPIKPLQTHADLDAAAGFAVRYYNDFVKPAKIYRAPTDLEREALIALRDGLKAWDQGLDGDALQSLVFACGRHDKSLICVSSLWHVGRIT